MKKQCEVAIAIGIGRCALSQFEHNSRMPSLDLLERFADYYEVTLDYLAGREGYIAKEQDKAFYNSSWTKSHDDKLTNNSLKIEEIRDNLELAIINYQLNQSVLKNIPYIRLNDIAIVCRIREQIDLFGEDDTCYFSNIHLNYYDIELERLFEYAWQNMKQEKPVHIESRELKEKKKINRRFVLVRNEDCDETGAIYGFSGEVLHQIGKDLGVNELCVVPYSKNCVVVVPIDSRFDSEKELEKLNVFNRENFSTSSLSNNIFIFDRREGRFHWLHNDLSLVDFYKFKEVD